MIKIIKNLFTTPEEVYVLRKKVEQLEIDNKNYRGCSRNPDDIKRIAELEEEVSQSDEILAEHDLINYNLMEEQDKRIAALEAEIRKLRNGNDVYFDPSTRDL
jgi:hypothetical protein